MENVDWVRSRAEEPRWADEGLDRELSGFWMVDW